MGLADDLLAPHRSSNRGATCSVELLLGELTAADPEGAAALVTVLADQRFPATTISRRLTGAGWELSAQIIQRHRRGECKCP
jgi:hypothetical protein